MRTEKKNFIVLAAAVLALAFAYLVSDTARAEESSCDPFGIHIGADNMEAQRHFLEHQKGWSMAGIETDADGYLTTHYGRGYANDVSAKVAIMAHNHEVISILLMLSSASGNDAGMKDLAAAALDAIQWNINSCDATVSVVLLNDRSAYIAERNDTAILYQLQALNGVTALVVMFGSAEHIRGLILALAG